MIDSQNKYGTRDRQIELLKMIKEVDALLCKGGVRYSLCGGTLLGAVREKGFIPWDDDVDIMVDRDNFNKLCSLFRSTKEKEYILKDILWVRRIQKKSQSSNDLTVPTIDVFVMDNCPDGKAGQVLKVFFIKLLQGMMKTYKKDAEVSAFYKMCLFITSLLGKPFSYERKLQWYDQVSQIGNKKATKQLGMYDDLFCNLKLKYNSNMFVDFIDSQFEDIVLPITKEYDNYLSTVYGDYMTPVEEGERKPLHLI